MYLKEMNVYGFKSFADKLKFEFNNGITGIVGPNGSGKSNVVDAVRWTLGEQSVKSLRGSGNMSDVIFSGTKTRKPYNMAYVNLIFDNVSRHINIDKDEISIKRIIHRNGENEYLLNNISCRLKDINNIFLDSGIGKDSFNIISQGDMSSILLSKPQDRRIIFEEAAGVLKYKKRKEEATRKLSKTDDNIIRINDIVTEIEYRLKPLEKQSRKAKNFLELEKNLKQKEIGITCFDNKKID
ncbi:MAG: chromosome segregation SMC family protein [Bacilli bacterium]